MKTSTYILLSMGLYTLFSIPHITYILSGGNLGQPYGIFGVLIAVVAAISVSTAILLATSSRGKKEYYIGEHVHCPNCKETLDAAMNTDATTGNIPSDGDISVCAYCGSINVFKEQENGELCLVEMPEDIKKELEEYYPEVWNRIAQLSNHFMKKAS